MNKWGIVKAFTKQTKMNISFTFEQKYSVCKEQTRLKVTEARNLRQHLDLRNDMVLHSGKLLSCPCLLLKSLAFDLGNVQKCNNIKDIVKFKKSLRGRSQTTLTSFCLFLTTYPPPLTFSTLNDWKKVKNFDYSPPSSCKRSLWPPPHIDNPMFVS